MPKEFIVLLSNNGYQFRPNHQIRISYQYRDKVEIAVGHGWPSKPKDYPVKIQMSSTTARQLAQYILYLTEGE